MGMNHLSCCCIIDTKSLVSEDCCNACAIKRDAGTPYADRFFFKFIPCLWRDVHRKRVWVLREIVLGYKGVGGGEREGREVDLSGI